MKEIRINKLTLENFKCHRHLELDFQGGNASIYGDNATGKTSIYDALTWLLFGKDSLGSSEQTIEIKPLDASGEVRDHRAITSVEAELLVDGEPRSFRRTYRELWTTKRGSNQATYDGNTSEFAADGVPMKKNAFKAKVDEILTEDVFRMLTSVSRFASELSWQQRREILFSLAGTMGDREIMSSSLLFQPLLDGMGRLDLDEYRRKLLAEKRQYVGAKTDIPARISEVQKSIDQVQKLDFSQARVELGRLQAELQGVETKILEIDHNQAGEKIQGEVREARMDLRELEAENQSFRQSQTDSDPVPALERRAQKLEEELRQKQQALRTARQRRIQAESIREERIREYTGMIRDMDRNIAARRTAWTEVFRETFSAGICPTCGQALPAGQLEQAKAAFESDKRRRLDEIQDAAGVLQKQKEQVEKLLASAQTHGDEADREKEAQDSLDAAAMALQEAKEQVSGAKRPEIRDVEGYQQRKQQIQNRLDSLNQGLSQLAMDAAGAKRQLQDQADVLRAAMKEQSDIISKESLLEYSQNRIETLRREAQQAADLLGDIEEKLGLMEQYSRYKASFVEATVNSLFRLAQFRLAREQANGGMEDRCDVMMNGIPYGSLNNGARINVGIDIINTLGNYYGVRVPLFVDNAESVTVLETAASQVIRLVVSENDKELRVHYEN